jgi:hypothetical protein
MLVARALFNCSVDVEVQVTKLTIETLNLD